MTERRQHRHPRQENSCHEASASPCPVAVQRRSDGEPIRHFGGLCQLSISRRQFQELRAQLGVRTLLAPCPNT